MAYNYAFPLQTEVLQRLSLMRRLVVSTGGGAVVRPINWYSSEHAKNIYFMHFCSVLEFNLLSCVDAFCYLVYQVVYAEGY